MNKLMSNLKMFSVFFLILLVTVLVLMILNWIPLAIRSKGIQRYRSVESVQKALMIRKIYLPSYFPDYLQWPPAEIFAQSQPFPMVLMHVKERGRDRIVLAIRQADVRASNPLKLRIEPVQITKQEQVMLKGRPAVLSLALCADGSVCNQIVWQEAGYTLTLVARDAVQELIRIATSMQPG
jgi:hypothetical protein